MPYKVLTCFLIAGIISLSATAQKSSAYLKIGVNLANVSIAGNGEVDDANQLTSFQVGFLGDLSIGEVFAIQPGLLFTGKGSKLQTGNPGDLTYYKSTVNPYYIELPVNAVFKFPLTPKTTSLFVGGGPYIAMGIAGKRKIEGQVSGIAFNSKENIRFSNDDPSTFDFEEGAGMGIMKRFDYGLNATIGLQINRGMLSVNYGYGLAKLQSGSNSSYDNDNKHRVLSLTAGFKL